ncbi:hypothetical protein PSTG_05547 [Puccinia striiformis f. sp. tritici PST-78]|uniref:Uncharacterized protein n=1 Tax=Puccinia striiformis f. sp. tritici PST-78 TaxID=1165861 RepID=A0A0L0VPQ4_9BASI|nr:hypothetical protein PSTG_05547 [Puccinia striiformis f. sp. tritici PST-78]
MVRRAQGGRSTQAVTGGQGAQPVTRRTRKPTEPPDIRVLEGRCQVMVHRIEGLLQYAVEHPLTDTIKPNLHPFQDMIPVIKLTRVFLNKLSRPTNNKPHPLLGMSSDNLLAIIRSTVRVAGKIEKFLHRMENDHASGARIDFEKVFDILDTMQRPIRILRAHFSQTENSHSPQGSTPKYREWLRVWNAHYCRSGCRIAMPKSMRGGPRPECSFSGYPDIF